MSGATMKQKDAFIKALNKQMNLEEKNTDASVKRVLNRAKDATPAEKRVLEEITRSTAQRKVIDGIIARDRANNNVLFGGNLRTRNLRKSDFD